MTTAYDRLIETPRGRTAYAIEHAITSVTELIAERLEAHEMTQADLAAKMGVTPGRVSQILDGDTDLKVSTVAKVLIALEELFEAKITSLFEDDHQDGWNHEEPWQQFHQESTAGRVGSFDPKFRMAG